MLWLLDRSSTSVQKWDAEKATVVPSDKLGDIEVTEMFYCRLPLESSHLSRAVAAFTRLDVSLAARRLCIVPVRDIGRADHYGFRASKKRALKPHCMITLNSRPCMSSESKNDFGTSTREIVNPPTATWAPPSTSAAGSSVSQAGVDRRSTACIRRSRTSHRRISPRWLRQNVADDMAVHVRQSSLDPVVINR